MVFNNENCIQITRNPNPISSVLYLLLFVGFWSRSLEATDEAALVDWLSFARRPVVEITYDVLPLPSWKDPKFDHGAIMTSVTTKELLLPVCATVLFSIERIIVVDHDVSL